MNLGRFKRYWETTIIYMSLILLIVAASLSCDVFLKGRNIVNIIRTATSVGLLSIGQTFTILAEGIDLSVGSVVSLTACLTAGLINGRDHLVIPVIILVLVLALFIGFLNGYIVTQTGVNPIIVTLGMMAAIQGIVLLYMDAPGGKVPHYFGAPAWGKVAFIPFPVFLLGIATAIGIVVLRRTTFGRYVYATGGNEEISRLSGIKTNKIRIITYMICSFCAALTGLYLVSRMGMGDPILGEAFMFDSIVPVLLGGTAFSGGKGGIVGTIGAVFILTILNNMMNLLEVSTYWQWIVTGGIIIAAVAFYSKET